jgi:hypothetical protein
MRATVRSHGHLIVPALPHVFRISQNHSMQEKTPMQRQHEELCSTLQSETLNGFHAVSKVRSVNV